MCCVECGICPIAAHTVTFRLTRTSVSGHMGIFYAEKVTQYTQNPEVKGLTYEDFKILRIECFEVTTLTSQSHVTSSVMWPFDSHYMISYRFSIDTDPLSWTVLEILSLTGIWVATFQGHMMSLVTWSFDSPYTISYRCSIGSDTISNRFRDIKYQMYRGHDLDPSRSHDVIDHLTIRLPLYDFL